MSMADISDQAYEDEITELKSENTVYAIAANAQQNVINKLTAELKSANDGVEHGNEVIEDLVAENKRLREEEIRNNNLIPLMEKQYDRLEAENKRLRAVIEKCIKAMSGSNCLELKWLEQALKEAKNEA